MPRLFVDIEGRFAQFQDALDKVQKNTATAAQRMDRSFRGVRSTILGLVGGLSIGAIGREMLRAGQEGEQSANRLTAAIRATGDQVGLTRAQLDEMADSLAIATQFDDEGLRNAQAQLIKFGNIQGDVFRRAITVSADLASFMGTDVTAAAQQIGRALQSPTEGITLLERSFGKLTEAQEKHIKSLAAEGRAVEAQNAVLEILQQRVGGTAELMNTSLTAATTGVSKAWGDMLEAWARGESLLPSLTTALGGLRDMLRDIAGFSKQDTDPFREYSVALSRINDEVEGLERALERAQPGSKNRVPLDAKTQEEFRARIEALRAERRELLETVNARRRATSEQQAFEEALAATPARPITLGGNTTDEAARAKAAQQRKKQIEEALRNEKTLLEFQENVQREANDATNDFLRKQGELNQKAADDQKEMWRQVFESIDQEQERAIEQGAILIDTTEKQSDAARDLGLTFSSAFEDAIIGGKDLSDILKGLEQDIARMVIRKSITEPLAAGISAGIGSVFGGARADGGPVSSGRAYLVGEEGPELFVPVFQEVSCRTAPADRAS